VDGGPVNCASRNTPPAHHALGLLLVRQRRQADARHELETAEQLVKRLEAEASR
jgi:hypothetical protein